MTEPANNPLQQLPSVTAVLGHAAVHPLIAEQGRGTVVGWARESLDELRGAVAAGERIGRRESMLDDLADAVAVRAAAAEQTRLGPVINATGVVLHTGLGRAPLSPAASNALAGAAGAANVEVDLRTGARRYRGHQLLPAWKTLTGCEDALVVNNNAAATLLTLQALCAGREVLLSRGQLIEIGGSFRLPEIFALSGAKLVEVGTTNRTKLADYERAITENTAAIMRVHPSNYRIVGFTESPGTAELATLAHSRGLTMIDDVGSGCLVDVGRFGLPPEPTFQESLAAQADVVLGSGDKLLGGPQAGIILGAAKFVQPVRRHPLARAVRVGKLTLAALAATLDAYVRGTAEAEIPTLRLLAATPESLLDRAHAIRGDVDESDELTVEVRTDTALVGGGSLPGAELPTAVLAVSHSRISAGDLAVRLRTASIRVVGRVRDDAVLIDLRSVLPEDDSRVTLALRVAAK
jgi:L-seryl-tRNA(Ser) seleniumtransferase